MRDTGFFDLHGKLAMVAGGSGSIGACCARRLAEAGARIIVGYHSDAQRARRVVGTLSGSGHRVAHLPSDDTARVEAAAAQVREAEGRLDVLVDAGGWTVRIPHADLDGLTDDLFDQILVANLRGKFSLVRSFAELLRASGDGVIVNISSVSGISGQGSNIAYCAAKAGADTMSVSLARVLGPQVRVLNVLPGSTNTDFVPGREHSAVETYARGTALQRVIEPDDVACAVLGAITSMRMASGSRIVLDGGPGPA